MTGVRLETCTASLGTHPYPTLRAARILQVQPFLEFVERIYRALPKTVTLLFAEPRSGDPGGKEPKTELAARVEAAQALVQQAAARAEALSRAVVANNAQAQARAVTAQQLASLAAAQPSQVRPSHRRLRFRRSRGPGRKPRVLHSVGCRA